MNIVLLKGVLLGVMFSTTLLFGLIPLKVMQTLARSSGKVEKRASFIISLLSCFAGGVFLAVCFLDMMPDAYSSYESWKSLSGVKSDYPFVPLLFSIGFFIVKIFEEIMGRFCGHEEDKHERRKHAATFVSVISNVEVNNCANCDDCADTHSANSKVKIVKSLTFVVALLFHASLEGFAFGVQETTISVTSLFCGIIVHKAVVSFSVGMRLAEAHPHRRWLVVTLIFIVALVTPVGGAIGITLEDSAMNMQTKDAVTCVLLSLALGTFIYITFFEILVPENAKHYNKFAQWFASVIGFAIIAGMMALAT